MVIFVICVLVVCTGEPVLTFECGPKSMHPLNRYCTRVKIRDRFPYLDSNMDSFDVLLDSKLQKVKYLTAFWIWIRKGGGDWTAVWSSNGACCIKEKKDKLSAKYNDFSFTNTSRTPCQSYTIFSHFQASEYHISHNEMISPAVYQQTYLTDSAERIQPVQNKQATIRCLECLCVSP